jgi:tRNA(Ser,Leu) C12 N-acetylase TAN1
VGKVTILWNQQVQTDRTIPNNKPGIIIWDNEKGTCMLINVTIPGDRNVIKKEAEKVVKYKDLNTAHVECKNRGDASYNRSNWNHFKILHKILEQRTGKARYQGTAENSYIGHSTHTAGSANVEAQKSLI